MPSSLNGTGVTFSNGSTQSVAWPGNTGTVTSVATGNGLQGGTITTSGTLSVACPTQNTVGSYAMVLGFGGTLTFGSNYAAGTGTNQVQAGQMFVACNIPYLSYTSVLSGTWKWLAASNSNSSFLGVACRVA